MGGHSHGTKDPGLCWFGSEPQDGVSPAAIVDWEGQGHPQAGSAPLGFPLSGCQETDPREGMAGEKG